MPDMERFEKAFLWAAAIVLVIFLDVLAYSSLATGIHLPSHFGMIHYTADQKLRQSRLSRTGRTGEDGAKRQVRHLLWRRFSSPDIGIPRRG